MADEVGKAFQKVGGTANALGVNFEKTASWIATLSSKTREGAEEIGNSIKSIMSRYEQLKTKGFAEEDGTQVNAVAKALSTVGIEIMDAQGNFKNFGDIMDMLGRKWGILDNRTRAYISTQMAGVYQMNRFQNLMTGYGESVELYNKALDASGTTQQKYALWLQSTEAHLNRLKTAGTGLWQQLFDTDTVNTGIEGLTQFVTFLTSMIDKFGLIPTVLAPALVALNMFNKKIRFTDMTVDLSAPKGEKFGLGGSLGKTFEEWGKSIDDFRERYKKMLDQVQSQGVKGDALASPAQKASIAYRAWTQSTLKQTVATHALRLGSMLLNTAISIGLSVGIGLLVGAITNWITKMITAREEQQRLFEEAQANIVSMESEISKIDALVKKYNDQTTSTEELKSVRNELAQLFPTIVNGYDAEGNAIDIDNKKLAENITLKKELLEIEKEYRKDSARNIIDESVKSINKLTNDIKRDETRKEVLLKQIANPDIEMGLNSDMRRKILNKELADVSKTLRDNKAKLQNETNGIRQAYASLIPDSDTLTEAQKKLAEEFLNVAVAQKTMTGDDFSEEVVKYINNTENQTRAEKELEEAKRQSEQARVRGQLVGMSEEEMQKKLQQAYADSTRDIKELASVQADLEKGESLNAETINDLVLKYPQLAEAIKETTDGYTIEIEAIDTLRLAQVDKEAKFMASEIGITQQVWDQLASRLEAYGIEIETINTVGEAMYTINRMKPDKDIMDRLSKEGKEFFETQEKTLLAVAKINALKEKMKDKRYGVTDKKTSSSAKEYDQKYVYEYMKDVNAVNVELENLNNEYQKQKVQGATILEQHKLLTTISDKEKEKYNDLSIAIDKMVKKRDTIKKQIIDMFHIDPAWSEDKIEQSYNLLSKKDKEKYNELIGDFKQLNSAIDSANNDRSQTDAQRLEHLMQMERELIEYKQTQYDLQKKTVDLAMAESENRQKGYDDTDAKYLDEIRKQIQLSKDKKKILKEELAWLESVLKGQKVGSAEWVNTKNRIDEVKNSISDVDGSIASMAKTLKENTQKAIEDVQKQMIDLWKEYYDKQKEQEERRHEDVIDNLDKELDAYEEYINDKIKALDRQHDAEDYGRDIADIDKDISKKRQEMEALAMDQSAEGQARYAQLKEELEELLLKKEDKQRDHQRDEEKKVYEDLLDAKRDQIDNQKEAENDYYKTIKRFLEDASSDTALFNKTQTDLATLTTQQLIDTYGGFFDRFKGGLGDVGRAIKNDFIDNLREALELLNKFSGGLGISGHDMVGIIPSWVHELPIDPKNSANNKTTYDSNYWKAVANMDWNSADYWAIAKDNWRKQYKKFKSGGLNVDTGFQWLDGTPQKPEYVLNPDDTRNILKAVEMTKDIYGGWMHKNSSSISNSNVVTISSNIYIYEQPNENTADLVKRIKKEVWQDVDNSLIRKGLAR